MAKPTPKVEMIWTGPTRTISAKAKREKGSTFYATRSQAKTFRALGLAADAPKQVEEPAPPPTEGEAGTTPRRRTYRRRDLRPEE